MADLIAITPAVLGELLGELINLNTIEEAFHRLHELEVEELGEQDDQSRVTVSEHYAYLQRMAAGFEQLADQAHFLGPTPCGVLLEIKGKVLAITVSEL